MGSTRTDQYFLSFRGKRNRKPTRGWKARWRDFRQNKTLVAVAFFLAVFTDCSALTLVQSLAPAIIKSMEYEPCNCSTTLAVQRMQLEGENIQVQAPFVSSEDSKTFNHTVAYSCRIGKPAGQCFNNSEVMMAIAGTVGGFGATGPFAELLANPVIAYACSKLGHRAPFLFGAVVQIIGSFLLMFAKTLPILFAGRVTQALASTTVSISGLLMVTEVFIQERERSQVLAVCYASAFPIAAMLYYPLGNGGYDLFGSYLPFGLLAGVSILDGILRAIVDTERDETGIVDGSIESEHDFGEEPSETDCMNIDEHSYGSVDGLPLTTTDRDKIETKKSSGSYLEVLTDAHVMVLLTITFVQCFAYFCFGSTAPNWVVNIINAKQWQLGIVLGVCGFVQLIANVILGRTARRRYLWLIIFAGHLLLVVSLVSYTFAPSIWWTIIPEMACRLAAGIVFGVVSNLLSCAIEAKNPANMARGFSFFVASYTLAACAGPFVGGELLEYIYVRPLYFGLAGTVVLSALLSLYMQTLEVHE